MMNVPIWSIVSTVTHGTAHDEDFSPVNNQDLPTVISEIILAHLAGNANVVEQAEPHWFIRLSMMTGRSDNGNRIFHLLRHDRSTRLDSRASGQLCGEV